MRNDPDRDLIRLAQKGDKTAYGKLVDQYYEMVYVLAKGVLRNHEAARDTAQDVFLKVWGEIKKFKGQSKFKTWLYRVAVNAAIDAKRKVRPTQSIDGTDATEEDERPKTITEHRPGPRDAADREETAVLVRKAIEELSPDHQAVILLREWEDMSYEDIAETLEIEVGTVMSRLHYARKKLAEILEGRLKG